MNPALPPLPATEGAALQMDVLLIQCEQMKQHGKVMSGCTCLFGMVPR